MNIVTFATSQSHTHYGLILMGMAIVLGSSCRPNSNSLRGRLLSSDTMASWLEVSTSYLEVFRMLIPYWPFPDLSGCEIPLSTCREYPDSPGAELRAYPLGEYKASRLGKPPFDVPRKLGMYLLANALSAGPLEAMIALFGYLSVISQPVFLWKTHILTSAPEIV